MQATIAPTHASEEQTVEQIKAGTHTLDRLEAGARRNLNKHLALDQFVFHLSGQLAESIH